MPDTINPLEQRPSAAETTDLEPDGHAVLRVAPERREIRPARRNRGGAGIANDDANCAVAAASSVARTDEDSALLHERVAALCRLLEDGLPAAHRRDAEAWRTREAELERRIAAERENGERRAAEARNEMRAEVERACRAADQARQDADQARVQREQDRERHRGAELAWMSERRTHLGRINQLELELERRRGFFARLLRRRSS